MRMISAVVFLLLAILLLLPMPASSLSTRDGILAEKILVDPSTRYIKYKRNTASGAEVILHVVKIRLDDKSIEIRPALEGGQIKSSAILADIARKEGAIAAINGGFFFDTAGRKLPVGELIINGALLSHSDFNRGCFIVDGDGETSLRVTTIDAFLNPGDYYEPILIHAMNVPPGGMTDAVHIYNRFWGDTTPAGDAIEIQVDNGVVIGRTTSGGTSIPENGFVITFRGAWKSASKRFVDGLGVGTIFDFDGEKGTIRHMLTGGPMFFDDGKPRDFADEYAFSSNVLAPTTRSCLCLTWNNEILFVCTRGAALTFAQLGELLSDLNVRSAIGLDGGGSSGMWVDGVNVPAPSRAIPNAVVLVKAPDESVDNISSGGLWGK